MAPKRRRRGRLEPKYRTRRAMLLLLLAAVVGVAAWNLQHRGGETDEAAPVDGTTEETEQTEPAATEETQPETEEETEPETEAETKPAVRTADWNLLLVNSTSPLPGDFAVELETVVDGYQVDARIADSLRRMFIQAKEDGISLMVCSAYRAPEKQKQLFQNQVQAYLDQGYSAEDADAMTVTAIARPGTSEHHTGLAVDIVTPAYQNLDEGFAETPAFKWLDAHAHEYGFVLRYPKNKENITQIIYEPWHYRYVGVEHAAAVKEAGYCLEEYMYVAVKDQLAQEAETEPTDPTDPE